MYFCVGCSRCHRCCGGCFDHHDKTFYHLNILFFWCGCGLPTPLVGCNNYFLMNSDAKFFVSGFVFCLVFRLFVLCLYGEFDPGSGRTLAACLTHASRTERLQLAGVLEWRTGE